MVTCTFEMDYNMTGDNQKVALIGNIPELGGWDSKMAAIAESEGGRHSVTIQTSGGTTVEFKWAIVDTEQNVIHWEDTDNKHVLLPHTPYATISAPWNSTSAVRDGNCVIRL